jgi:alkanesulfonate monooxygenase SsuD/methylene tetrahydromethanopterin reductase-like flavin-dependent oxidoreductase (luciferase family)
MSFVSPLKKRPLKVGLGLPLWSDGMAGKTPTWQDTLAFARHAEEVGVDSLWVLDNFALRMNTGKLVDFWECWSMLSALAASTSRITLGSFVTYAGYRHPILLAKIANTIEEISAGRLVLGLGAGYTTNETQAAGFPTEQRYERLEETLAILQQFFHHGSVHLDGQLYQIHAYESLIRGPRPKGPPILLGSLSNPGPRLMKLAAQYAQQWNGWLGYEPQGLAILPALRKTVDEACQRIHRSPQSLERSLGLGVVLEGATPVDPDFAQFCPHPLKGTPEQIAEALLEIASHGFSEVQISLNASTLTGLDTFALVLDYLDKELSLKI